MELNQMFKEVLGDNGYHEYYKEIRELREQGMKKNSSCPEYIKEKKEKFDKLIRENLPDELENIINSFEVDYKYEGKTGPGPITQAAEIPWVRISSKNLSKSATEGYYIVYLFTCDGQGVYLSLNQGTIWFNKMYKGSSPRKKITKVSSLVRERLNTIPDSAGDFNITLGPGKLAKDYAAGHICGRYYDLNDFPENDEMIVDLKQLLRTYYELEKIIGGRSTEEFNSYVLLQDDGLFLEIDETEENNFQDAVQKLASEIDNEENNKDIPKVAPTPVINSTGGTRWPRSREVSATVLMKSNYTCEYDQTHKTFKSKSSNNFYVEAHHLLPMSKQGDHRNALDQEANVIALCPLCHRIVHHGADEEKLPLLRGLYEQRVERLKDIGVKISFDDLKKAYGI